MRSSAVSIKLGCSCEAISPIAARYAGNHSVLNSDTKTTPAQGESKANGSRIFFEIAEPWLFALGLVSDYASSFSGSTAREVYFLARGCVIVKSKPLNYYAKWNKAWQDILDGDLSKAWKK
jgi:hypothetical protein